MDFNTIGSIIAIFVGICALGVSICALLISIWQGFETRKNYRLSVTPSIAIVGNWVFGSNPIGITLENKGIGPAKIISIELMKNGMIYNYLSNPNDYLSFLKRFFDRKIATLYTCQRNFDVGEMIAPGEVTPLFWLDNQECSDIKKIIIYQEIFCGITIRVKYESIYGKKYTSNHLNTENEMSYK
jgi:hypothetical protein